MAVGLGVSQVEQSREYAGFEQEDESQYEDGRLKLVMVHSVSLLLVKELEVRSLPEDHLHDGNEGVDTKEQDSVELKVYSLLSVLILAPLLVLGILWSNTDLHFFDGHPVHAEDEEHLVDTVSQVIGQV